MVCSETAQTVLEAGTWTNAVTAPNIFGETDEIQAGEGTNYIVLGEDTEDIERSSDGTRIHAFETCTLKLFSTNTIKRGKYIADIEAIFKASSQAIRLRSGTPSARRGRYIREYLVELTTTS